MLQWRQQFLLSFLPTRYNMDVSDDYYEQEAIKRTIDELINECPVNGDTKEMHSFIQRAKKSKRKMFGQTRHPFLEIPLSHVVIDELHLMLRITDVLTDNIIKDAIEKDKRQGVTKALDGKCLKALVKAMRECGLSFSVWEKVDGDGPAADLANTIGPV